MGGTEAAIQGVPDEMDVGKLGGDGVEAAVGAGVVNDDDFVGVFECGE